MTLASWSSTIRILPCRMSWVVTIDSPLAAAGRSRSAKASARSSVSIELVHLDRLGEVAEEARLQAFPDVAGHGVGADGEHRDVRRRRILPQAFKRLEPADARQVDVHQDHRRLVFPGELDAQQPVARAQQAQVRPARDELLDQLQVGRVVFHVEQGPRCGVRQRLCLRRGAESVFFGGEQRGLGRCPVRTRRRCPTPPSFPPR